MKNKHTNEQGFNLIELMIVIAVIALLISISGYAWQVMIRRGNEAAAVGFVNKINTAQAYFASKNKGRFAKSFRELVAGNLLDKSFDADKPAINGYMFTMKTGESPQKFFSVNANPEIGDGLRATGTTRFYIDSASHAITYTEDQRAANSSDPSL